MKGTKRKSVPSTSPPGGKKARTVPPVFHAVVREGDTITFDTTGEEIRITRIEDGKITFEKLP